MENFDDYPARCDSQISDSNELEQEVGFHYAKHTALLQTWLYFGLLAALSQETGLEVDLSRLVR